MSIIKGHNMIITIGGYVVAASRECSLSVNGELIEIAGTSAKSRSYIEGRYDYDISTSGLYQIGSSKDSKSLVDHLKSQSSVQFIFQANDDTNGYSDVYSGSVLISSCQYVGSFNQRATYSCSMKGTGDLSSSRQRVNKYSWDPEFALVHLDGTVGYRHRSFIEDDEDNTIDFESQSGCGLTLRVYPKIKNWSEDVPATNYSIYFNSVRAYNLPGGQEMQLSENFTPATDYVDILLEQDQWRETYFKIELYNGGTATGKDITIVLH